MYLSYTGAPAETSGSSTTWCVCGARKHRDGGGRAAESEWVKREAFRATKATRLGTTTAAGRLSYRKCYRTPEASKKKNGTIDIQRQISPRH